MDSRKQTKYMRTFSEMRDMKDCNFCCVRRQCWDSRVCCNGALTGPSALPTLCDWISSWGGTLRTMPGGWPCAVYTGWERAGDVFGGTLSFGDSAGVWQMLANSNPRSLAAGFGSSCRANEQTWGALHAPAMAA